MVEPALLNINVESVIKAPPARSDASSRSRAGQGRGDEARDRPRPGRRLPGLLRTLLRRTGGGEGGGDSRQRSLGTGIIVDPKGIYLTNRHVVNAEGNKADDRIRVKIQGDPVQYDAKVIARTRKPISR